MTISRRDLLAGIAAGAALTPFASPFAGGAALAQAEPSYKPEEGASLRVLRWSPFVKAEEEAWLANTEEVHRRDGRRGEDRQGELGGYPAEGRRCR